ncbi:hypothetical protein [uncultured Martelella sp.]|uniref:hypothetical protein n=1 Tax=uncultured Martelella sp. TaxID=392331 RepID=UPI0029C79C46|nr:hypothetical protein [uncultured Martelella sp.]
MQVKRYLKDKHFDHIDHALGRPVDPMGETYRNYFAANANGDIAREMAASPYWQKSCRDNDIDVFHVTRAGREALRDHLKAIGDQNRLYQITWLGMSTTVVSTSAGKARYAAYLDASGIDQDLTFKKFQAQARVRLAGSGAS